MRFFLVALGGAAGSVLRYIVSGLDYRFSNGVFPVSTLVVNVTGSFVIGFLWACVDRTTISPQARLFIFIGVLGGYTTFSTFSLETFHLLRDGEYAIAFGNMILSCTLSVAAVFLGFFGARTLLKYFS